MKIVADDSTTILLHTLHFDEYMHYIAGLFGHEFLYQVSPNVIQLVLPQQFILLKRLSESSLCYLQGNAGNWSNMVIQN